MYSVPFALDMTDAFFDKLAPVRLTEQIATRIEDLILGNRLRPGDKLPSERELGSSFGVSRPVIRESIKLLEERGLLASRNGRGAFVTDPGYRTVSSSLNVAYRMQDCSSDDLYEARWCTESSTARLAAERATDADIARMEAAVQVMDDHLDDLEQFMVGDIEFHAALAGATHNPLFVVMTRPLVEMIHKMGHKGFTYGHVAERHENHRRILDAIKRRDVAGAEESMHRHLNLSKEAFSSTAPDEASIATVSDYSL